TRKPSDFVVVEQPLLSEHLTRMTDAVTFAVAGDELVDQPSLALLVEGDEQSHRLPCLITDGRWVQEPRLDEHVLQVAHERRSAACSCSVGVSVAAITICVARRPTDPSSSR